MTGLAEVMKAVKTAVETFNNWLMGDMELVIDSIRDGTIKALVKQNCACSLDFSLKEEIENAFKEAGLEAEAEVLGWDVERSGYKVEIRLKNPG
ncbi:hypothetical protein APE_1574a [Aeropyrum pernix K1]|uniref:Uncharacterized protein n=1 Tax=Aeropyrum pernix (strain ATCC 700893 / DSM 11879 / JCM 9820 / NBRC 100138 / K1) TaxID=272557 RepID=Q05E01_AERPE|nr:hypothetical protein [Aeropyrum pernix]BAF34800.1 hypothetical protein APE_1574a [Aeropyrum pernix K1]